MAENEIIGEKIVSYCRKKVSERVVPYTSAHRAPMINASTDIPSLLQPVASIIELSCSSY